jgi:phage tail sheath gpL-like
VDRSERAEDLAAYSRTHGFDFTYAVTPTEVAQALAAEFGDLVLNPPATPVIVVGTDGTVTLTPFGHKGVDTILQLASAHGA